LIIIAVAVRVRVGELPLAVTVKVYDPAIIAELTVTASVDELPPAGLGLNMPVAPAGRPLTDRVTEELNPPVRVRFAVYETVPPVEGTVIEEGLTDKEKSVAGRDRVVAVTEALLWSFSPKATPFA